MPHPNLNRAIELFNHRRFYDAHEAFEDLWREASDPDKRFLQGLVQLAVAFHHHSAGNAAGTSGVLARAIRNLEPYPAEYLGIQVAALRKAAREFQEAFGTGDKLLHLPRVIFFAE